MKKHYFSLIILYCLCLTAIAQTDNSYVIESVTERSPEVRMTKKTKYAIGQRVTRARGTIINIRYDNPADWNAGQKRALEYGVKLWEEQLMTCYPLVNLRVKFQALGSPLATTKVRFYPDRCWYEGANELMTGALLKNWQVDEPGFLMNMGTDRLEQYIENDDITITFNNENDLFYWGTDGNTPDDKYDFVTLILREMAKGFEINSSITKRGNSFSAFVNGKATNFDIATGITPETTPSNSQALANAAQDGLNRMAYYEPGNNKSLVFYVPSVFIPSVSFNYLTEESSTANNAEFLAPTLPKGAAYHQIPEIIGEFMERKLGWGKPILVGQYPGPSYDATASQIDFNQGMTFSSGNYRSVRDSLISGNTIAVTPRYTEPDYYDQYPEGLNYDGPNETNWRLDLLKTNGKFVTVKTLSGYSPTFQILPADIPDTEEWARSADGDIRARIYHNDPFHSGMPYQPSYTHNYIFLDYYPAKPELSAVTRTNPATRSSNPMPELMLAYKAWGATSVKLVHSSEDGIVTYFFSPDEDLIDMTNADPYIVNTFKLTAINNHGQKISNEVTWGGEAFMAAYNTYTRKLDYTATASNLNLELVTVDGQGTKIEDENIIGSIRKYDITKIDNPVISTFGNASDSKIEVSTQGLQRGVYAIRVFDEKGASYVAKFVKN